jgi:hypothetical protein
LTDNSSATTHTNTIVLGNGTNSITIDTSGASSDTNITNNVAVGSGNNTITFTDSSGVSIKNNVTLNAPNQDINHYTAISDTNSSGGAWNDLVLTFSNTINPNNSSASTIAQATVTGSTFLPDLNQAIAAAASSITPFAYFNVVDSSVPGHTNSNSYDTVIVDHASSGTTFVPGQDAFIVLVGVSITGATVASGAIHVAA